MSVTYGAIASGVANSLKLTGVFKSVENYDALSEGIPVLPCAHVYPVAAETDSGNEAVAQSSFKAGVRVTTVTINVDVYARQRSQKKHDIKAQVDLIDAVDNWLTAQPMESAFGVAGIRAVRWSWERTTFVYGEPQISYAGAEFTLMITVF
jgi:hypothetical protein